MRRYLLLTAALIVMVLAAAQATPASAASSHVCDLEIGPGGSPQALVNKLVPGQTGCLRKGTYDGDPVSGAPTGYRETTILKPNIVLRSYPGERATLLGRLVLSAAADQVKVEDLNLSGTNPLLAPSPTIDSTGAVLRDNKITNHHTAVCVLLGDYAFGRAEQILIEGNVIHDCGVMPALNHNHGIYVSWAIGTVIRSNVIYGNADRGIQLFPDATGTKILGNVISGNGQGVIFGGDEAHASTGTLVRNNVIANSTVRFNVESSWGGPVGFGNRVTHNCLWSPLTSHYGGTPTHSGVQDPQIGFSTSGNLVANPRISRLRSGKPRIKNRGCARLLKK
jgi:parallel beta-helix repeat protein